MACMANIPAMHFRHELEEKHTENARKGEEIANPTWEKGRHSGIRGLYYTERQQRYTEGYGMKDFAS